MSRRDFRIFIIFYFVGCICGVGVRHCFAVPVPPIPTSPVTEVYTSHYQVSGWCSDGEYAIVKSPSSLVITNAVDGHVYGTSYYSGRWSGPYFIARDYDTVIVVGKDTAMMYGRCYRGLDFYTR